MYSAREKTWRPRLFDAPTQPAAGLIARAPSAPCARPQRVWAFMCPNPLCDTELVVFPDHSGERVQCPSCGFEFVAPRVVPIQIIAEEDIARPASRAFAPGAAIARPAVPDGPPSASAVATPAALRPPVSAPRSPTTKSTADALAALALASQQPGAHPAPARLERRDEPRLNAGPDRRGVPRANLAPRPVDARAVRARREKRMDLALTWIVAVVVSAGLGLAAWIVGVPDLALGSILFVGLAAVRTFRVAKPKRADRPPG